MCYAGVLAVSWYPPGLADDNGEPWDEVLPQLLNTAHQYKLKVRVIISISYEQWGLAVNLSLFKYAAHTNIGFPHCFQQ